MPDPSPFPGMTPKAQNRPFPTAQQQELQKRLEVSPSNFENCCDQAGALHSGIIEQMQAEGRPKAEIEAVQHTMKEGVLLLEGQLSGIVCSLAGAAKTIAGYYEDPDLSPTGKLTARAKVHTRTAKDLNAPKTIDALTEKLNTTKNNMSLAEFKGPDPSTTYHMEAEVRQDMRGLDEGKRTGRYLAACRKPAEEANLWLISALSRKIPGIDPLIPAEALAEGRRIRLKAEQPVRWFKLKAWRVIAEMAFLAHLRANKALQDGGYDNDEAIQQRAALKTAKERTLSIIEDIQEPENLLKTNKSGARGGFKGINTGAEFVE